MVYLDHIPLLPANCLKEKQRDRSTPLKEISRQSFQAENSKLLYITRFFQRQPQENFAKFLVTLQSEGGVHNTKKDRDLAFFYGFVKQFHNSNS